MAKKIAQKKEQTMIFSGGNAIMVPKNVESTKKMGIGNMTELVGVARKLSGKDIGVYDLAEVERVIFGECGVAGSVNYMAKRTEVYGTPEYSLPFTVKPKDVYREELEAFDPIHQAVEGDVNSKTGIGNFEGVGVFIEISPNMKLVRSMSKDKRQQLREDIAEAALYNCTTSVADENKSLAIIATLDLCVHLAKAAGGRVPRTMAEAVKCALLIGTSAAPSKGEVSHYAFASRAKRVMSNGSRHATSNLYTMAESISSPHWSTFEHHDIKQVAWLEGDQWRVAMMLENAGFADLHEIPVEKTAEAMNGIEYIHCGLVLPFKKVKEAS